MKTPRKTILASDQKCSRRGFLRESALIGGSLLVLAADARGLGVESAPTAGTGTTSDPANDTIKTIRSLRTIHGNFLDKPLPEPALQTILQSSLRAANASNSQSYSIIVVKDRKMMKDLCGYRGSCLLLYCADFNREKTSAESLGYVRDPSSIVNFVYAATNTSLAAQTAVIAAKSLGIDSLLTNGIHRGDMERIWTLLDLPQTHCFPVIALVLGYPTQEPTHQMGRLDGAGVIHHEKYHRLTTEEVEAITRQYDDKERHLGLDENWDTNGYQHYLDWYFKAWVRVDKAPRTEETQMLRLLKRSGFVELQKT
jgi:nitroreductase